MLPFLDEAAFFCTILVLPTLLRLPCCSTIFEALLNLCFYCSMIELFTVSAISEFNPRGGEFT